MKDNGTQRNLQYNHGIINWDISRGNAISGGIVTSLKNNPSPAPNQHQVFLYPHKSTLPPSPTMQCWSLGVGLTCTSYHVCEPTLYSGGGGTGEEEDILTVQMHLCLAIVLILLDNCKFGKLDLLLYLASPLLLESDIIASSPNVIIPWLYHYSCPLSCKPNMCTACISLCTPYCDLKNVKFELEISFLNKSTAIKTYVPLAVAILPSINFPNHRTLYVRQSILSL